MLKRCTYEIYDKSSKMTRKCKKNMQEEYEAIYEKNESNRVKIDDVRENESSSGRSEGSESIVADKNGNDYTLSEEEEIRQYCYYCEEECNQYSQICGRCARLFSGFL